MKVHVVASVYHGVLQDVCAFLNAESAKEAHRKECEDNEVPLYCTICGEASEEAYNRYKDSDTDNDVQHQVLDVNISPIIEAFAVAVESTCSRSEDLTTMRVVAQEFVAAMNRRKLVDNAEAAVIQRVLLERLG